MAEKKGDCNLRYFHSRMNWRRKWNALNGLLVDGRWVDDPIVVKKHVKDFFVKRFANVEESRARFNRVPFNEISVQDNVLLVFPFGEKEVSKVV